MDITKELAQFKKEVDTSLEVYLNEVIEKVQKEDVTVAGMLRYFKKTLLAGGKRIRPAMMYYGYIAAGGRGRKKILRATMSVELIHAFLLMHDDIIDRDDVRHGHKTTHAQYRNHARRYYKNTTDADHFGMSVGIIIGDLIYSLGNQVLFTSGFDADYIVRAMTKLQSVVGATALGEMQDVIMEYKEHVSEEEILRMYEHKTARYTFEGPFELGALLAGASVREAVALSRFAVPLGIAFQLQDDYLGIFGSAQKTGKPVGSDISEGKQTLFVARALNNATSVQQRTLRAILGKRNVTQGEITQFCALLDATGTTASVMQESTVYLKDAHAHLEQTRMAPRAKKFVRGLITYLAQREH